jgi:hypothetical protein
LRIDLMIVLKRIGDRFDDSADEEVLKRELQ